MTWFMIRFDSSPWTICDTISIFKTMFLPVNNTLLLKTNMNMPCRRNNPSLKFLKSFSLQAVNFIDLVILFLAQSTPKETQFLLLFEMESNFNAVEISL